MEKAPFFHRRKFPTVGGRPAPKEVRHEESGKRTYDYIWSKLSQRFRRKHPFCRFCEQKGLEAQVADLVDHIIPTVDRTDLRLTWSNLQSLCHSCHNGLKRRLEEYARKHDMLDMLPQWCADPESRPRRLR